MHVQDHADELDEGLTDHDDGGEGVRLGQSEGQGEHDQGVAGGAGEDQRVGSVINPALGVLLALGQAPADLPEGFAATATVRRAGIRRSWRLLAAAGFTVPIVFGAALGYLALRGAPQLLTLSVLTFTGGALLSVAVEEMVPQAHEEVHGRQDAFYLVTGFALFAAVSTYLPA